MNFEMDKGIIRIADNVVAVIASIAALETDGIAAMSGGIAEGIAKRVSGKQVQKGVDVQLDNESAVINLRIVVQYGSKIDEVCKAAQRHVKDTVENMTGIKINEVNIKVDGVDLTQTKEMIPSAPQLGH